ncbi:hypothetical protein BGX21_003068 [Mortierella sp. AD011]|nr:hypothetical protein BGX20_002781 [Mortierella sp. AD010]KAF9377894.1 hypothetical protein BGX21_003068 [Mortierella sp. AD011]
MPLQCPQLGGDSDNNGTDSIFQSHHLHTDLADTYESPVPMDIQGYKFRRFESPWKPTTPPKSLPSDPYAHYIYHKELSIHHFTGTSDDIEGDLEVEKRPARTIIVGDVHGNLKGFDGFLKKVKFDSSKDRIILAGDMVAKGPQSLELIDRAMELGALCVRGNHDDKVIRWRGFLDSLSLQQAEALGVELAQDDDIEENAIKEEEFKEVFSELVSDVHSAQQPLHIQINNVPEDLRRGSAHHDIAKKLSKKQYNYLKNCPLILTLPRELSHNKVPIHVVHAGIDPKRGILKQQPWVLINVRNLLKDGTPSSKKSDGQGWAKTFNDMHHQRCSTKDDFMIVYGHDAGRSLNVKRWSVGLDTGCVYGRQLTGYVVETGQILSVSCPSGL